MKPIQHVIADSFDWEIDFKPTGKTGWCGWCKQNSEELFKDLPVAFLEYENLGVPADNAVLCHKCMTAIRGLKPIRWGHMHITQDAAVMSHNPPDLYKWLSNVLPADQAVICNTNNQKRPLYNLRWGHVATSYDQGTFMWTAQDTENLGIVKNFRELGVNENQMAAAAPPHKIVAVHSDLRQLYEKWDHIKNWNKIKLECAILATRKPKNVDPN